MNKCFNCDKETKNKYCDISCQNKHQNTDKANRKYGEFKDFEVTCNTCSVKFLVCERERLHPKKDKYYCSRSCANKRSHNQEVKDKISKKLLKPNNKITLTCINCNSQFIVPFNKRNQKHCSRYCNIQRRNKTENLSKNAGKISVNKQSELRRSKNEIYFAELCEERFNTVLTNEPMFNGWDADIIIEDIKVAVLWNGKWHYEKITKNHSVEQVQNRDKIKIGEIKKFGYTPYVIKDIGKYNKEFVNGKFKDFLLNMGIY